MKNKSKLIVAILTACILAIGCNKNIHKEYITPNKSNQEVVVDEENDIPYIKSEGWRLTI